MLSVFSTLPSRYERKFLAFGQTLAGLVGLVKRHPANFREIYHERQVNNVYFDTGGFGFFQDNVDGVCDRIKARVRWYGEMNGSERDYRLEFKIKNGLVSKKAHFELGTAALAPDFTCDDLQSLLDGADLSDSVRRFMDSLVPSLQNSYRRRYFRSFDNKFRLTLDYDLSFNGQGSLRRHLVSLASGFSPIILEMKYAEAHDDEADAIGSHFPFRVTNISKYVMGLRSPSDLFAGHSPTLPRRSP